MTIRRFLLTLAVVTYPCLAADGVAKLSDLAFLEGRWIGEKDGGKIEEVWTAVTDNNMSGVFRFLNDDQAQRYELKAIDQTNQGIFLYLRHFGQKLAAGEEKPMVLFGTPEPGPEKAVRFERIDKPETRMKIYYRIDGDKLTVAVDQLIERKRNIEVYEYQRAGSAKSR